MIGVAYPSMGLDRSIFHRTLPSRASTAITKDSSADHKPSPACRRRELARADAVEVVERAERNTPALLSVGRV